MYLLLGEPSLPVVEAFRAAIEERGQSLALLRDFDENPALPGSGITVTPSLSFPLVARKSGNDRSAGSWSKILRG